MLNLDIVFNKTLGFANYENFELPYAEAILQIYKDEWLKND